MPIATVNPATGRTVKTFEAHSDRDVEDRIVRATRAAAKMREIPAQERARLVARLGDALTQRREELAKLMTLEMGKLHGAALAEVDKCALGCRFYAENGPRFVADEVVQTDARRSFVRYQPLGVVLAVMPWNFPLWQVVRFAAPALAAGNVGLLKHASNVPQCALAMEDLVAQSGFPEGAFQTLLIGSDKVAKILQDPRVAAATLTGSEGAGRSIGETCGRNLKKVVLELGGSDPYVVLPSADLDKAIETAVTARIQNAGQSCIAAKRFIVHRDVHDKFSQGMAARMKALRLGDPSDPKTEIGPLASAQVLEDLEAQVRKMVASGSKVLAGGKRVARDGFFFEPTVLTDAGPGTPGRDEEIFGPVATVFRAEDIGEAISLANATRFGLGASAWSRDAKEIERLANDLWAGQVFINGMVKSDPRLPFGGVKASGHGRELSAVGLREFVNVKTVWVGEGGDASPMRAE
ncbi:MAG TPA: NAD-dependent succinate-semialdehyde dehydrogenase [Myxococcales bacterium]|nr:NAD-dependent succinate-semialdehyde dehydrogenase [Myxococcales bacterium]